MLLSLLIPTLESRRSLFNRLYEELQWQIRIGGWESEVEILSSCDAGRRSVGAKRNELLARASGLFVAFIDDDDQVSADYVNRICETIQLNPGIDCIGIRGVITFRGTNPREFVHSLRYADYFSRGQAYFRPPYHLNPIRRSIAARYRFPDVSYSEDIDWALRIRRDEALKHEAFIEPFLYFYHSRRPWAYQWLLDKTETFRHKFGIRLANRISAQHAIRSFTHRFVRLVKINAAQ